MSLVGLRQSGTHTHTHTTTTTTTTPHTAGPSPPFLTFSSTSLWRSVKGWYESKSAVQSRPWPSERACRPPGCREAKAARSYARPCTNLSGVGWGGWVVCWLIG